MGWDISSPLLGFMGVVDENSGRDRVRRKAQEEDTKAEEHR